jgi:hypothetical protein
MRKSSEIGFWSGAILFSTDSIEYSQTSKFRGRIVGSATQDIKFSYNVTSALARKQLISAAYALLPPGEFIAQIDLRYSSFDPEAFNATQLTNIPIIHCSLNLTKPSSKPLCPKSVSGVPGYWSGDSQQFLPAQFQEKNDLYSALKNTPALESLHYTHANCELISNQGIHSCLSSQGLDMCLYGDSQTRNLNNAIIGLIEDAEHIAHPRTREPKEVRISQQTTFISGQYGTDFGKVNHTCKTIFVNFGQWPAGYPEHYAWTVPQYARAVKEAVLRIQFLNPKKLLIWLTTHPYGEVELLYKPFNVSSGRKDWRNEVVLREYNEAAKDICREVGVEFIEVFDVINAVHDLAFDGFHYNGPIERQIARTVLHRLCVR